MCEVKDCERDINRDGLCLRHKLITVNPALEGLKRERLGTDVTGGMGTSQYVRDMYESRRAAGLEDPEPMTKDAARYAPARGVSR